jgi:hypothetical protein
MSDDPTRPWHLPYEDVPDGPIEHDVTFLMVGGFHVRSATLPLPAPVGRLPMLLFDFTSSAPDAPRLPSIGFVGSPEVLSNCADVIRDAVDGALREHHRLQGGK